jgi:uncharacterized protein involved in exopolysaccharide biosynthesis
MWIVALDIPLIILLCRELTPRPRTAQRDELKETIASLRSQYTVLQEQVKVDRERVREQEQEIARLQRNAKMAEQAATTALRQAEADNDRQSAAMRREKQSLETERRLLQSVSDSDVPEAHFDIALTLAR